MKVKTYRDQWQDVKVNSSAVKVLFKVFLYCISLSG